MSKIVSVSQLKVGDKFAFANGQSGGAPSPLNQESKSIFVVTRQPAVNLAANTCYFRYQADESADSGHGSSGNRESHSFNGSPDLHVRLPGSEPDAAPTPEAAAVRPAVAAREVLEAPPAKPVVKRTVRRVKPKAVSLIAPPAKSAGAAKPVEAKAPPTPARPSPEKSAPRQGFAILPSLTKASATPKKAVPKKATSAKVGERKTPERKEADAKGAAGKSALKKAPAKKTSAVKPPAMKSPAAKKGVKTKVARKK